MPNGDWLGNVWMPLNELTAFDPSLLDAIEQDRREVGELRRRGDGSDDRRARVVVAGTQLQVAGAVERDPVAGPGKPFIGWSWDGARPRRAA
jgi:hypothetical protein